MGKKVAIRAFIEIEIQAITEYHEGETPEQILRRAIDESDGVKSAKLTGQVAWASGQKALVSEVPLHGYRIRSA